MSVLPKLMSISSTSPIKAASVFGGDGGGGQGGGVDRQYNKIYLEAQQAKVAMEIVKQERDEKGLATGETSSISSAFSGPLGNEVGGKE